MAYKGEPDADDKTKGANSYGAKGLTPERPKNMLQAMKRRAGKAC